MSKFQKICPVKFLSNFRVLTPLRIRQKHELRYISSDSGPDCAEYGRSQIQISIGTHLCENIKRIGPVKFSRNSRVLTPTRIRQKHEPGYISSDSDPDCAEYGRF